MDITEAEREAGNWEGTSVQAAAMVGGWPDTQAQRQGLESCSGGRLEAATEQKRFC